MPLTRRRLLAASLGAALIVPASAAVEAVLSRLAQIAPGIRPTALGTTATRCAQCGGDDHSMLDLRCPRAPRIA